MEKFTITRDDYDSYPQIYDTKLFVIQALYGKEQNIIDVTDIVLKLQNDKNAQYFKVSNTLFTDPYPGVVKDLTLTFNDGHHQDYIENSLIDIKTYQLIQLPYSNVIKAFYGYMERNQQIIDVTSIVRSQNEHFNACNTLFTDPCIGQMKSFVLIISDDNGITKYMYPEQTLISPYIWRTSSPTHIIL